MYLLMSIIIKFNCHCRCHYHFHCNFHFHFLRLNFLLFLFFHFLPSRFLVFFWLSSLVGIFLLTASPEVFFGFFWGPLGALSFTCWGWILREFLSLLIGFSRTICFTWWWVRFVHFIFFEGGSHTLTFISLVIGWFVFRVSSSGLQIHFVVSWWGCFICCIVFLYIHLTIGDFLFPSLRWVLFLGCLLSHIVFTWWGSWVEFFCLGLRRRILLMGLRPYWFLSRVVLVLLCDA